MQRESWAVIVAVALAAAGAYAWYSTTYFSKSEITESVSKTLQEKLDQGDLAEYHMHLEKLTVLHEEGNKYKGLATVTFEGKAHEVPVDIIADGKNLAWEVPAGSFMFAAQERFKKSMADVQAQIDRAASQAAAAIASAAQIPESGTNGMPDGVAQLVAEYEGLNEKCRGGSGDASETQDVCASRDTKYTYIKASGWCWGHKNDIGADRKWVMCQAGD
ncbi:hypothetical protein [Burkholderia gladioli]|uniref:hypothetical protein n=1 Tax=Burkholderia gladioli TaxID=28095 RepID=UPI001640016C|nr:hypothetical protein [Burkholderia gladioli]